MFEPALQIHPMVPLAKASAVLKISRDELIRRLSSGELLGEKRRIGESKKDSWFIYAEEFDRLLAQALVKYEERISTRGMDHVFQPHKQATGQAQSKANFNAAASDAPDAVAQFLSESVGLSQGESTEVDKTITIEPVSMADYEHDPGEIVDALGVGYALGSDYDSFDSVPGEQLSPISHEQTGLQVTQTMVAQLVQHLQDEKQVSKSLSTRLGLLEDEMESLRRELLARPDKHSHSPFSHLKNYFRLWLGKST
jgi:hypothetical protein